MPQRRVVTGRSHEPRARFAEELRLLRAGKGVSLRELAEELGWDASTLGKMESGRSLGSPEIVEALDQYYGTPGMLLALWELAVGDPTQFVEKYRAYMELEANAVSLWHYASANLPGLLQTPGYAREFLTAGGLDGDELAVQVEARMGRRELLTEEDAPRFRTIISEAVLRTPTRDPAEWQEQLEHLRHMSERKNVTIQVVPLSVGLHALTNTNTMFLRGADGRTVAWVETGFTAELIEESREVERLQLRYDLVRDLALSPGESREFIRRVWEEAQCEPST
ncbi:helix-turn-helix transcriptional regulator [Streptomyces sp. MBT53]|uniref:helix-turn-helix domain-containing protein n=1 Tax=Streptomyces sp. MBT53 TaxID=1488384 RepID=UPI0019115B98|nr:helix-turn-helix transcriptional regulator [Streptomyces sp. MBT53]MBK6015335.1 helix-turn-helix domain-containing protein [Streptomyces sp. MBT53]